MTCGALACFFLRLVPAPTSSPSHPTSFSSWSRFSTFRIYGETTVSDAKLPIHGGDDYSPRQGRATLLLRPSTPAFAMQDSPYTFAVLNVSNINAEGRLQPNILMR